MVPENEQHVKEPHRCTGDMRRHYKALGAQLFGVTPTLHHPAAVRPLQHQNTQLKTVFILVA